MNRRDFLRLLAQSAAAVPTTYFVFGNGVWKPSVKQMISNLADAYHGPDVLIADRVWITQVELFRRRQEGWYRGEVYADGFDDIIAKLVREGAMRIEPVPEDTPLMRMLDASQPRTKTHS